MALLLMKIRPFISATSTLRSRPSAMIFAASSRLAGILEVAGEMVERAERQDAERRPGPNQRRGGGADRSVPAADDDQGVAAIGDRLAPWLVVAALNELDLRLDAGALERRPHIVRDLFVRGDRTAAAVEEDRNRHLDYCSAGPIRNAQSLLPSRSRK